MEQSRVQKRTKTYMANWLSTKYFMLKHTASIWNGWFEYWFWNKLTLKRFLPPLSLSDLLPRLEAEPDLPHFIPWDHTSRFTHNPSPLMCSAICSSSVALSPWLPKPGPPDTASNISIRTVSCQDFFSLPTCHPTCSTLQSAVVAANTYCVLLETPLASLSSLGTSGPSSQHTGPRTRSQPQYDSRPWDGVPSTWAVKSWNSSGRIQERG